MRVKVILEDLGEKKDIEASVSFWYFDEGEEVTAGADLLEVITDKATFNVPSPAAGTLVKVNKGEGDAVAVGEVLGEIEAKE